MFDETGWRPIKSLTEYRGPFLLLLENGHWQKGRVSENGLEMIDEQTGGFDSVPTASQLVAGVVAWMPVPASFGVVVADLS